jgi:hypothetical protein
MRCGIVPPLYSEFDRLGLMAFLLLESCIGHLVSRVVSASTVGFCENGAWRIVLRPRWGCVRVIGSG